MPLVAYTDPQGVFGKHEKIVQQHLKSLKNLHWRPPNGVAEEVDSRPRSSGSVNGSAQIAVPDTTIRTIPLLDLHLIPESGDKPRQHQIPGLSNAPLVQILVIGTAPLEIYREKLRQIGKNWFSSNVAVRDPTGYVVVHAISPQDSPKLVKSIWTRLHNEFSSANCIQINVSDSSGPAGWTLLQQLVASQLLTAFDLRIELLQTEIRKLKSTQDMPGWNFGAFFAVHESLASAYASLNLVDDAFRIYQYLEKIVAQKPRDIWASEPRLVNNNTVFSGALTDFEQLNMRDTLIDLVLSQKSSYFDIQQSLLVNQVDLLMQMAANHSQNSDSLADSYVRESVKLVIARLPMLRELLQTSLGQHRALTWLLNAIRGFILRVTEVGSPRLASCKADLVLIERDYLQALSELNGWKIPGVFNDVSLDEIPPHEDDNSAKREDTKREDTDESKSANDKKNTEESNQQDLDDDSSSSDQRSTKRQLEENEEAPEGLESEDTYKETFFKLTNTAIQYYANANFHRAVLRLQAQILLIKFHEKKFKDCWEIYEKHPQLLAGQLMPAAAIFAAVLACSRELGLHDKTVELSWKVLDLPDAPRDLVVSAVSEIENTTEAASPSPASASPAPSLKPQSSIVSTTRVERQLSRWFIPNLVSYIRADDNGYYLELKLSPVRPRFPFVKFSSLTLSAEVVDPILGSKREIYFESNEDPETINADGSLEYKLYTSTFVEGVLNLQLLEMWHKGSTKFTHTFYQLTAAMRPLSSSFTAHITLAKDHSMKKRNIELKLRSPIMIKQAKVQLLPVDPQLQLLMDRAKSADSKSLQDFTEKTIEVPVLIDFEAAIMRLKVVIEYTTSEGGHQKKYEFYEHLNFALAVSVNFQESFRQPPRILTQFLVKPFNQVPAVFLDASLEESSTYEVSKIAGSSHYNRPMIAYNNAPVSYVFNIAKKAEDEPATGNPVIQFLLTYRSLLWECQHILFETCLKNIGPLRCYSPVLSHILEQLSPHIDLAEYVCSGKVKLSDDLAVRTVVTDAFQYMDPKHGHEIADLVLAASQETYSENPPDSATWDFSKLNSTMYLEVPDPDAEVVHYISLRVEPSSQPDEADQHQQNSEMKKRRHNQYAVGEPITATLTIESITFRQEPLLEDQLFEYELDRLSEGWSYTGLVKGQFKGGSKVCEQLSLIPTRSGELFLPNVVIKPLILSGEPNDNESVLITERRDSAFSGSIPEPEGDQVIVSEHANTRLLIVPDINMLAITF